MLAKPRAGTKKTTHVSATVTVVAIVVGPLCFCWH